MRLRISGTLTAHYTHVYTRIFNYTLKKQNILLDKQNLYLSFKIYFMLLIFLLTQFKEIQVNLLSKLFYQNIFVIK